MTRLPNQTRVRFDIAQGLATGGGVIAGARYDDGWLYRLDQVEGTGPVDPQRNERGELWAWDSRWSRLDEGVTFSRTGPPIVAARCIFRPNQKGTGR